MLLYSLTLLGRRIQKNDYNFIKFEWDENKAAINLLKHQVSFEEAKTVFDDPLYVDLYDPDHSDDEERYLIIGESNRGRLLIMLYTERGNSIRLISAREVTRSEREAYKEG
nr:BrnT family toxin [Nostoc sp. FACHB-888]